jgi:TRAP transporter TAXI family solute receptor
MKIITRVRSAARVAAFIVVAAISGDAAEQRSATLATHAVGSLYNALGTGIATVISRHTPITVRVQPFAGPPAWLPSMNVGETDMGVLTSADAVTSYKGIILYKKPFQNTRILVVGGALQLSFYVPKDAPIETVADLKGKRIPADYPGTPIVRLSSTAALATAGLTYNDIIKVPVSDLQSGAQAFMEGRTDAGWHSVGSPAVEEANARRGGVKFISVVATPEGAKKMADVYPGSYPSSMKAGSATAIIKDTALLTNDIYLVAGRQFTDEAAYNAVKALWDFNQELGAAYPALKEWRRERMVSKNAFIPYHPGAVKFFKEKQIWSKEMEALQSQLLAQ